MEYKDQKDKNASVTLQIPKELKLFEKRSIFGNILSS